MQIKCNARRCVGLFVVVLTLCIVEETSLADWCDWYGNGSGDNWSTDANWWAGAAPVNTGADGVRFNDKTANEPQTSVLDYDINLYQLEWDGRGNRDVTLNSSGGSAITNFVASPAINVLSSAEANLTVNCELRNTGASFRVQRAGTGRVILNGPCVATGYLYASGAGCSLELGASNTFTSANNYNNGEIVVNHPYALGNGQYIAYGSGSGTLSLSTSAIIQSHLRAGSVGMNLRLKDSGTNDVTLTIEGYAYYGLVTQTANAGTSTGELIIRIEYYKNEAEWNLATNGTLVLSGRNTSSVTWGHSSGTAIGTVSGLGAVAIDSGGNKNVYCWATNSYTGGTTIRSGRLTLPRDDRLPVAGDLVVKSGGSLHLQDHNQTVSGLSGEGLLLLDATNTVNGTLTVNGILAPGMGAGTLTGISSGRLLLGASSTSQFELDALASTSDQMDLKDTVNLTLDGTLEVVNLGALEPGDYTLFKVGGTISGSYASISMPKGFNGVIDTSTGDVVLNVTALPEGTVLIIR